MKHSRASTLLCGVAAATAAVGSAAARQRGSAGAQEADRAALLSEVTITGSVLEPRPIDPPDDAALTGMLTAPEGAMVEVFARDLVNPRMLAFSQAEVLYVTRRDVGDVVMLRDDDGDGRADPPVTVASRFGLHGIAFHGGQAYLAAVNDVYVADVAADGSFGPLQRIIDDLPDGGQHQNRTLAVGPDGMLYISAGSTFMPAPKAARKGLRCCGPSRAARAAATLPAVCAISVSTGSRERASVGAWITASTGWAITPTSKR